jgi:hypothetical protein
VRRSVSRELLEQGRTEEERGEERQQPLSEKKCGGHEEAFPWSTKRESALMRYQGLEQRSPWMSRRGGDIRHEWEIRRVDIDLTLDHRKQQGIRLFRAQSARKIAYDHRHGTRITAESDVRSRVTTVGE